MADDRVIMVADPLQIDELSRQIEQLNRTFVERNREVDRVQESIDRAANRIEGTGSVFRATLRTGVAGTALVGAGSAAIQAQRRGMLMPAARALFRGQLTSGALTGAMGAAPGLLGRAATLASNLHPILKLGTAIVGLSLIMGRNRRSTDRNTRSQDRNSRFLGTSTEVMRQQTRAVTMLTVESRRGLAGLNPAQTAAFNASARDPLGRSVSEIQRRRERMGTTVTASQVATLTALAAAENELAEAREQTARTQAQIVAPYRTIQRRLQEQFELVRANFLQGFADPQAGASSFMGALGSAARFGRSAFLTSAIGASAGQASFLGFGIPEEQADPATQAARDLFRLQQRGPAGTMELPPTIRPGTRGEHEFRVRQNRQELYLEAQRVWQDQILELMRQLVEAARLDPEVLARTEIQFGREVTVGIE